MDALRTYILSDTSSLVFNTVCHFFLFFSLFHTATLANAKSVVRGRNLPEPRADAERDVRARVSLHSAMVVAVVLQEKKFARFQPLREKKKNHQQQPFAGEGEENPNFQPAPF